MKTGIILFFVLLIATSASAQQKIGVVSQTQVMQQSSAAKKVEDYMKALLQTWTDTAKTYEKMIDKKREEYRIKGATMSDKDKLHAADTIRTMQSNLAQYNVVKLDRENGEFVRVQRERSLPVIEEMRKAVGRVAKKAGVDVVTNADNVIYLNENVVNLTADVVKEMK